MVFTQVCTAINSATTRRPTSLLKYNIWEPQINADERRSIPENRIRSCFYICVNLRPSAVSKKLLIMRWLERHWYRKTPLSFLLLPLSWLYCLLILLRRGLYRLGVFPSVKLPGPVIVVGNLTVGGSAADWPHGVTPQHDPDVVGDEAVLLARQSECPVAADPDRVRGAQYLLREHRCNVILSDDGLQHLRLARDMEIAVIDGERRFGNGYCLPAGPLREPIGRLRDVSLRVTNGPA